MMTSLSPDSFGSLTLYFTEFEVFDKLMPPTNFRALLDCMYSSTKEYLPDRSWCNVITLIIMVSHLFHHCEVTIVVEVCLHCDGEVHLWLLSVSTIPNRAVLRVTGHVIVGLDTVWTLWMPTITIGTLCDLLKRAKMFVDKSVRVKEVSKLILQCVWVFVEL